jgi:hypothetical protein
MGKKPMIPIFIHIPRTGGSTMRSIMDRHFIQTARIGPEFNNRQQDAVACRPNTRAWYGHHHFGLHEHIEEKCEYFTILREPEDRIFSAMRRRGMTRAGDFFARYPHQSNMATRMLSGMDGDYDARPVEMHHLDQAILNITDHFFAVGLFESLHRFIRNLGWLPDGEEIPHLNAGPLEEMRCSIPPEHIRYDLTLYKWVSQIAQIAS